MGQSSIFDTSSTYPRRSTSNIAIGWCNTYIECEKFFAEKHDRIRQVYLNVFFE